MSRSHGRESLGSAARAAACIAVVLGAIALLGSCSGERPTLGAVPPSVPGNLPLTDAPAPGPTSTTVPREPGVLGPEDLLGWIATPKGEPEVYAGPDDTSERLDIGSKTDAGAQMTFAVVGDASGAVPLSNPGWYEVALPTRPNGSTGWVPTDSVTVQRTPLRLFVDLGARTLRVERDGVGVFSTTVAVGTEVNPTPVNGTYIIELIENIEPDGAYGPYAYGLAMHSDTLTEFAGGDGRVGIHGTNRPDLIGQAVSHGCVRLTNADVQELIDLELPLGAPVFIT